MTISDYLSRFAHTSTINVAGPFNRQSPLDEPVIFVDGGSAARLSDEGVAVGDGDSSDGRMDVLLERNKNCSDLAFALESIPPDIPGSACWVSWEGVGTTNTSISAARTVSWKNGPALPASGSTTLFAAILQGHGASSVREHSASPPSGIPGLRLAGIAPIPARREPGSMRWIPWGSAISAPARFFSKTRARYS